MKYVKIFCIATILLNVYTMYGGAFEPQTTDVQNEPTQESVTHEETPTETETPAQTETTVEEKDVVKEWKDHLELLTIEGEYWNAEDNIPTNEWKSEAFRIAKEIVQKDATQADTLKTEFLDAITAKITLEKGKLTTQTTDLIEEFKKMIQEAITPEETKPQEEAAPEVTPAPPVEETPAPTSVTEVPATPTETPAPVPTETTTPTPMETPSATSQDVSAEWEKELKKVAKEGSRFGDIDTILTTAYDVANRLIASKPSKTDAEQRVLADFYDALQARDFLYKEGVEKKLSPEQNLYPLNVDDTMNFFKRAIGMFVPEEAFSYNRPTEMSPQERAAQQEFEKLRAEYAQKDELARAEREKMEKQIQAALELARKRAEETIKKPEESDVHKLQLIMHQEIEKAKKEMAAKAQQREKKLRETFAKTIEQQAATKKAAVEQGIVSTITTGISNWWYGTSAKKPGELSPQEQERQNKMFEDIAKSTKNPEAVKRLLQALQDNLLAVTTAQFWNEEKARPNTVWITEMQKIIFALVITYDVMTLPDILDIVHKGLAATGKMTSASLKFVITEIQRMVKEHEQKLHEEQQKQEVAQQEKEARLQQRAQIKRDKQEQILLAQQKIRDEQERKEQELKKHEELKSSYKDHKKEWYAMLDKVAQHKPTTHHENRPHTHEALKHSQKLLHLAHHIPSKNKHAIAQKLKEKFAVALLEQHKNNPETVNIYHDMDIFNQEINKMLD